MFKSIKDQVDKLNQKTKYNSPGDANWYCAYYKNISCTIANGYAISVLPGC